MREKKTKRLTMGAVFTALSIILLILSTTLPLFEMTLLALASAMPALMIIETGVVGGLLVYGATSILGLIIVPNKVMVFPYIFLFGLYGIVKFYAEKIKSTIIQMLIKITFFTVAFYAFGGVLLANTRFSSVTNIMLVGIGVVFALIFDYIYSLGLGWYMRKFNKN